MTFRWKTVIDISFQIIKLGDSKLELTLIYTLEIKKYIPIYRDKV